MPVNPLLCAEPSEFTQKSLKQSIVPLFVIGKDKLDKAQARRLKMPKRNRSAYFLFSMDIRVKLKAEPNNQLTPLETQALVSKYWKDLPTEEKEKYEQRAKEEKLEYLVAMDKFYSNLTPETIEKSKTNKPKKPCSAYAHFVRDIKTNLKKENPRLIMQEILHIVSDKWKNLAEETRAIYEEKAKIDKEQYMAITRNLNSETYERFKRREGNDKKSSNLGKRSLKAENFYNEEQNLTKYAKVENFSEKSENPVEYEEIPYMPIKIEEYKETLNLPLNPFTKIDIARQQIVDKLRGGLMFRKESRTPINFNPCNERQKAFEMTNYNGDFIPNIPTNLDLGHYMYNNLQNEQQMQQAMVAKVSLMRMVQNHQNLKQMIMRKIMEIKALQAQRMMANGFFLDTTNVGGF